MTVKELIALLNEQNQDRLVVLSRDAEGNGYSPLAALFTGAYVPSNPWSGEVGMEAITELYSARGFTEEDVRKDGVPCLVLSPTN